MFEYKPKHITLYYWHPPIKEPNKPPQSEYNFWRLINLSKFGADINDDFPFEQIERVKSEGCKLIDIAIDADKIDNEERMFLYKILTVLQ